MVMSLEFRNHQDAASFVPDGLIDVLVPDGFIDVE
jgi:hypothetical protein